MMGSPATRAKTPALLRAGRVLCSDDRRAVSRAGRVYESDDRAEERRALARDLLAFYRQFVDPRHPGHALNMGEVGPLLAGMEAACMFKTLREVYLQDAAVAAAQRVVRQWEMIFLSALVRGYAAEVEYMAEDLRDILHKTAAPAMSPVDDDYTGVKLVVLPDGTASLSPLPTPQIEALMATATPEFSAVPEGSIVDLHRDPSTSYLDALLFRFRAPEVV
eukprot:jgi/Tetstr1/463153/TSEL_008087.t1